MVYLRLISLKVFKFGVRRLKLVKLSFKKVFRFKVRICNGV